MGERQHVVGAVLAMLAGVSAVAMSAAFTADALDAAAGTLQKLHSVLVSHRGPGIFERYDNGARAGWSRRRTCRTSAFRP